MPQPAHPDSLATLIDSARTDATAVRLYGRRLARLRSLYGPFAPARADYRALRDSQHACIRRYFATVHVLRQIHQELFHMTHRSWHPNPTREHNSRMAAAAIILSRNPQLHDFWGATQDHCAGNDGADIGFWFGELFGRRIEQWLDAYADQTGTDIDTQDAFYIVYRHMASLYPEDVQ